MKTASIVILERGNRWGGLLRRELQPVIAASDSRKVRWQIREVAPWHKRRSFCKRILMPCL